jgi:peptidoglycan/LPS O-acetylase OafA/YrhL
MQRTDDRRITYLDGLRGWAAFVVLTYHASFLIFHAVDPIYNYRAVQVLIDGALAVYVFFVVSGFALSIHFLETDNPRVVQALALRRYIRLGVPIFFASLASYLLLSFGLMVHQPAAAVLRANVAIIGLDVTPSLPGFLKFALYGVFFQYRVPETYDPPLWSMSIELFGSFIVFAMLLLYPKTWSGRIVVFGGFLVGCLATQPIYSCFLYGVLLAHISRLGVVRAFRTSLAATILGLALIAGVALFSAYGRGLYNGYSMSVAGCALVAAPVVSARIASFFSWRISRFLGRVSFSLYLTHYLVICSLSSWVVLALASHGVRPEETARVVPLFSIVVSLLAAAGFYRIEAFAIDLSRKFSDWCLGRADAAAVTDLAAVRK